jgi:hypothetical protein
MGGLTVFVAWGLRINNFYFSHPGRIKNEKQNSHNLNTCGTKTGEYLQNQINKNAPKDIAVKKILLRLKKWKTYKNIHQVSINMQKKFM